MGKLVIQIDNDKQPRVLLAIYDPTAEGGVRYEEVEEILSVEYKTGMGFGRPRVAIEARCNHDQVL